MPTVVHLKREGGVVVQDCSVYISRPQYQGGWKKPGSVWQNPFAIAKSSADLGKTLIKNVAGRKVTFAKVASREDAIRRYREYIYNAFLDAPDFWVEELQKLPGQTLGCWCKPEACHGDVLVEFLRYYFGAHEELNSSDVASAAAELLARGF